MLLRTLNTALQPFRGSYHGTRIVINTFSNLNLDAIERWDLHPEGFQSAWQEELSNMCNNPERDPESLQVAQVLNRADLHEPCAELRSQVRNMNGHRAQKYLFRQGSYTYVIRGKA